MSKRLLLLTSLFCTLTFSSQAQAPLSLSNLLAMQSGDLEKINGVLLSKGWVFTGPAEDSRSKPECSYPELGWAYHPRTHDSKAAAFISLYKGRNCGYVLNYQTTSIATYNQIVNAMKANKMRPDGAKVVNDGGRTFISNIYEGNRYIVQTGVSSDMDGQNEIKNGYVFLIWLKSDD